MALTRPNSMEELIYFTQRALIPDGKGDATVWVFKQLCPKCKKEKLGKPKDSSGKVKMRAKEYLCSSCGYRVEKEEYEESLLASIAYVCPKCSNAGELQAPFIRKKVARIDEESGKKQMVDALRFQCQKCAAKLDITRKMK